MVRLLIICALLTAFASPAARERIRPYLSPVLDPAYEWSVRSRVGEIARKMETELAAGRPLPKPGSIEDFVNRHYPQDGAELDPWGVTFQLSRTSQGFRVVSAGPDRTLNTADDVLSRPISDARSDR